MTTPIDLQGRLEPFMDDFLIAGHQGTRLQMHQPERREIVFQLDQPWECGLAAFFNLHRVGDTVRMYYRAYYPIPKTDDSSTRQTVGLAETRDGVHFTRPVLGLVEDQGSTANNLVWRGTEGHNFSPFMDERPGCPPEEKFKAVAASWQKLYCLISPDGIHWRRLQDEPAPVTGHFDTLNVCFWDKITQRYRLFTRLNQGVRQIQSCESLDFRQWSTPVLHRYDDQLGRIQFYTNATTPCPGAEHILLSFPKRFLPERQTPSEGMVYPSKGGVSDTMLLSSRDGQLWHRWPEAWVRPGRDPRNWTHRSNMVATGVFEFSPGEWSIYISEHYGWPDSRLRRLAIRRHGLVSLAAGLAGGEALTKPLVVGAAVPRINASTSAGGSLQVEVQSPAGQPLPGYTLADFTPWFGDDLDVPLSWGGKSLASLVGQAVRLRFVLSDADLYSLRFAAE